MDANGQESRHLNQGKVHPFGEPTNWGNGLAFAYLMGSVDFPFAFYSSFGRTNSVPNKIPTHLSGCSFVFSGAPRVLQQPCKCFAHGGIGNWAGV